MSQSREYYIRITTTDINEIQKLYSLWYDHSHNSQHDTICLIDDPEYCDVITTAVISHSNAKVNRGQSQSQLNIPQSLITDNNGRPIGSSGLIYSVMSKQDYLKMIDTLMDYEIKRRQTCARKWTHLGSKPSISRQTVTLPTIFNIHSYEMEERAKSLFFSGNGILREEKYDQLMPLKDWERMTHERLFPS